MYAVAEELRGRLHQFAQNWGIGSAQLGTTQGVAGQRHRPLSHRFWWAQHSAFGYNISILIKKLTILIYKYYNLIDNYIIYLISK
ncbi:unnamed protein product [Fusarium graminearum]|nr:unnamed protein product [Fusarium graminearum]